MGDGVFSIKIHIGEDALHPFVRETPVDKLGKDIFRRFPVDPGAPPGYGVTAALKASRAARTQVRIFPVLLGIFKIHLAMRG